MESMMKLPDDMFKQELLPYLTVDDIVNLDNVCMSHEYRPQLLDKISGVILLGDKAKSMKASLFKWLGMRRIYLINMNLLYEDDDGDGDDLLNLVDTENNYVDQFRYTQHVISIGDLRDDMAMFIISHCPCLLSIDIGNRAFYWTSINITDHILQSIAEHCSRLQSLSLRSCEQITDTGLITISEHCPNLKSIKVSSCRQITDASILSISIRCTKLQLLDVRSCSEITDASIISISTHCTRLESLHLQCCHLITDASILSISTHCSRLQLLDLANCDLITDASIISVSAHCTGLQ